MHVPASSKHHSGTRIEHTAEEFPRWHQWLSPSSEISMGQLRKLKGKDYFFSCFPVQSYKNFSSWCYLDNNLPCSFLYYIVVFGSHHVICIWMNQLSHAPPSCLLTPPPAKKQKPTHARASLHPDYQPWGNCPTLPPKNVLFYMVSCQGYTTYVHNNSYIQQWLN